MYCQFYGFSEKPFDVTPDPRFLYLTAYHREALAALVYGIDERRGFIVLTGEAGTGKTTLLNSTFDRINATTRIAYIFNTCVSFQALLHMALFEWGVIDRSRRVTKAQALYLINEYAIQQLASGCNVVLVIDEAQNLQSNALEELRLLSNLETRQQKLVQIVLSGQPELDGKLLRHDLRQLTQRISLRRSIQPLSEKETFQYLDHRINTAQGTDPQLFSAQARRLIWKHSAGIARKINILCDNCLLIGFGLKKNRIGKSIVKEAIDDLESSSISWKKKSEQRGGHTFSNPGRPQFLTLFTWGIIIGAICMGAVALDDGAMDQLNIRGSLETVQKAKPLSGNEKAAPRHTALVLAPASNLEVAIAAEKVTAAEEAISLKKPAPVAEDRDADTMDGAIRTIFRHPLPDSEAAIVKVRVGGGETLSEIITRQYGPGTYATFPMQGFLTENPAITSINKLYPGQVIRLPAHCYWTDAKQQQKKRME